jgi:hypothetical protein
MRVVLLTNDPVRLSVAQAALTAAGIAHQTFDAAASVMDGSIGAIPRRLVVAESDEAAAREVLTAVGVEPSRV